MRAVRRRGHDWRASDRRACDGRIQDGRIQDGPAHRGRSTGAYRSVPAEQILGQRGREVVKQNYKSALHEMAETTPTDYWNDSCSIEELTYGIEHGAVGATSNPVIVYQVLQKEMPLWTDRIKRIIADNPGATEDEVAWIVIEQMALGAAKLLKPVYDAHGGLKGRLSIQTDPKLYRNTDRIVDQAVHFATVAENVHVKIPATKAGIAAIEEVTAQGVNVNATVSFSVAQSIAVAEAVDRGLARREKAGADTSTMAPVCTIMVGRVDDWLKVVADKDNIITDPENLEWAGVAVMKNAYRIYRDRGYRTRLLAAAYRNHYQWSQLIGGDVVLTIPYKWAKRFNGSGMVVESRMEQEVDPARITALKEKFVDFNRMYEPDGMRLEDFDTLGATVRTLRQFNAGYADLVALIREFMLPNPDV